MSRKAGGHVHLGPPLSRGVVIGESVMVVVPTLAERRVAHQGVICRHGGGVVGSVPPEMGHAVDQPGAVEGDNVTEHEQEEDGNVGLLVPEVPRNEARDVEREEETEWEVVAMLEHNHGVFLEVAEVNVASLLSPPGGVSA